MKQRQQAILYLEDGTHFIGLGFGAFVDALGEVVFNTSMTGYQEVLTDPSYAGQIVTMTQPEIGNYGTNSDDEEANRPFVRGFVVKESSRLASNWRSQASLDAYLCQHQIPGICGIDTRALVRHIRQEGAMRGMIAQGDADLKELSRRVQELQPMAGSDYVREVTTRSAYDWNSQEAEFAVVAYDFGIKQNILRSLVQRGCSVKIVPADTPADEVLKLNPDGVFLSNGPGDPEPVAYAVENVRRLIGERPLFGICLGHQLLGLALGGKTFKLKFGHRGANHPVKNLIRDSVEITAQNHGFAVDPDSLDERKVQLTHLNLNDQTLEGLRHRYLPVFSVQYHPEASPGPHDSYYLFDDFVDLMREYRRSAEKDQPDAEKK